MVLCCDMRSLCLPSIPPASYRVCGCLAIGDSYEKSYITKINNLGMTIYLFGIAWVALLGVVPRGHELMPACQRVWPR